MTRAITVLSVAVLAVFLSAEPAWAWGPAMHIFVGSEILSALSLLPLASAGLLRRHPFDFLYGCIAADITFGKKYAPVGRHCHHWHIGAELYDAADTDATRACAVGYLAHLAGDTLAHNVFLPRRLVTSATTHTIGHSYWEHRMDIHLGQTYLGAARKLITEFDHSENDALLDRILDRTVFSFRTNRRIFRGMIRLADHTTWQAFFDRVIDMSRWDVTDDEVETWMEHAFNHTLDYLVRQGDSPVAGLDPTGAEALQSARRLRRQARYRGAEQRGELEELADERFPVPEGVTGWWSERKKARGILVNLVQPGTWVEEKTGT